jgi:hypothetical protein
MTTDAGRAQTTLDFAVGVSLFLVALAIVFSFIPGTLGLFTDGGQADIVASNRVATSLSEGLLGDPGSPHLLNTTCTVAFFSGVNPSGCRFEGTNVSQRVGLNPRQTVNITLQGNLTADDDGIELLCWDPGNGVVEADTSDCAGATDLLRIGPPSPTSYGMTVSSRRVVEFNETDVTLLVEVW